LPRNGLASQLSLLSSETPTASESSQSDGPECPSSPMSDVSRSNLWTTPCASDAAPVLRPSRIATGRTTDYLARQVHAQSSSPVGSLANLIPLQESVKRLLTIVTSGPRLPVSFAGFDRDGSSGRMFAVSSTPNLDGSSAAFSGTWPTWGIALDGACGELPTLERCTSGSGSSLLPTPDTMMGPHGARGVSTNPEHQSARSLEAYARRWPTPTSRDHKDGSAEACKNVPANGLLGRVVHQWRTPDSYPRGGAQDAEKRAAGGHSVNLQDQVGGSLNPTWVEWLMGFPLGWTALEPSEMPSSRSKRSRSSPKSQGSSVDSESRQGTTQSNQGNGNG
jgi:hypothetical protein